MNKKRPNVVFILTDDQRAGTVRALGNNEIFTPNMDELVRRGTSFTQAHIPGGTASAVCMPSRAMLNCGRSLFCFEDNGKNICESYTTMGEAFRAAGYDSFGIGKWHNGTKSFARSFCGGENIFFGGMWDHWNVPVSDYREDGAYLHEIPFVHNFSENSTPVNVVADRINAGVHSTDLFSDSAKKYLKSKSKNDDEPFFLYLSFLAPHDPRTMPKEFRDMYNPDDITLPKNYKSMPDFSFGWATGRDEVTAGYPRTPEAIKRHICDYYAMISHIDCRIGELLAILKERELIDNTIIVLCGDNGLAIGQHGLMGKQSCYEHSTNVPLIMCGPEIPQNVINDKFVYLFDVFPTLCELCGLDIPKSVEGKSFYEMFKRPKFVTRKDLYYAFQARIRGVSDGEYKLIEYRTENLKLTQLFNISKDPYETENLFDLEGYEEITARLRTRLREYSAEWNESTHKYGRQFWQQYDAYESAAVHGIDKPKGSNMANQVKDWK